SPVQNKLVMAHVLAHVDFFKNNIYFSKTNRRIVDSVSAHAGRVMDYEFKYGRKTVESFLDAVLAIEEHIDPNFFIRRQARARNQLSRRERHPETRKDGLWDLENTIVPGSSSRTVGEGSPAPDDEEPSEPLPEKDLVFYLMKNSPALSVWQRDIMA